MPKGMRNLVIHVLGVPKPPPGMPSKLHEARFVADIQTNRLLGQLRAAVK